jgi:hypothetical protein
MRRTAGKSLDKSLSRFIVQRKKLKRKTKMQELIELVGQTRKLLKVLRASKDIKNYVQAFS